MVTWVECGSFRLGCSAASEGLQHHCVRVAHVRSLCFFLHLPLFAEHPGFFAHMDTHNLQSQGTHFAATPFENRSYHPHHKFSKACPSHHIRNIILKRTQWSSTSVFLPGEDFTGRRDLGDRPGSRTGPTNFTRHMLKRACEGVVTVLWEWSSVGQWLGRLRTSPLLVLSIGGDRSRLTGSKMHVQVSCGFPDLLPSMYLLYFPLDFSQDAPWYHSVFFHCACVALLSWMLVMTWAICELVLRAHGDSVVSLLASVRWRCVFVFPYVCFVVRAPLSCALLGFPSLA